MLQLVKCEAEAKIPLRWFDVQRAEEHTGTFTFDKGRRSSFIARHWDIFYGALLQFQDGEQRAAFVCATLNMDTYVVHMTRGTPFSDNILLLDLPAVPVCALSSTKLRITIEFKDELEIRNILMGFFARHPILDSILNSILDSILGFVFDAVLFVKHGFLSGIDRDELVLAGSICMPTCKLHCRNGSGLYNAPCTSECKEFSLLCSSTISKASQDENREEDNKYEVPTKTGDVCEWHFPGDGPWDIELVYDANDELFFAEANTEEGLSRFVEKLTFVSSVDEQITGRQLAMHGLLSKNKNTLRLPTVSANTIRLEPRESLLVSEQLMHKKFPFLPPVLVSVIFAYGRPTVSFLPNFAVHRNTKKSTLGKFRSKTSVLIPLESTTLYDVVPSSPHPIVIRDISVAFFNEVTDACFVEAPVKRITLFLGFKNEKRVPGNVGNETFTEVERLLFNDFAPRSFAVFTKCFYEPGSQTRCWRSPQDMQLCVRIEWENEKLVPNGLPIRIVISTRGYKQTFFDEDQPELQLLQSTQLERINTL